MVYIAHYTEKRIKNSVFEQKKINVDPKKEGGYERGPEGGLLSQYVTGFNLQLGNCLKITFAGSSDDPQYGNVFRG